MILLVTSLGKMNLQRLYHDVLAMAYYDDGTPKRSQGVFYEDINMVWTRDMDESEFEDMREDTNYVPKEIWNGGHN